MAFDLHPKIRFSRRKLRGLLAFAEPKDATPQISRRKLSRIATKPDSTAPIRFIVKLFSLANYTLLFAWIERQDHSVHMSSVVQVHQLYTAGIPLLEAYLLPMANNRTHVSPKNKMAASHVVARFIRKHVFCGVKNGRLIICSRTNRKRSSFTVKHFQRKSLNLFDLHPLLRRLVSFVAQIIT